MEKKDLKIVFFGTPEFAVESLDALITNDFNIVGVVTMPDKIAGRGHKLYQSDVKRYAVEHDLYIMQPEKLKSDDFINSLRSLEADLFIVIAFRMLPREVWQMPRLGTFNLHASLLPKYRGAAPINRAVMNGDTETGVTTFFLKHEIDTGDMIMQRKIDILPEDNVGDVHDKLMHLGAEMVVETVNAIVDGTINTTPQPDGEFTPAPKIFKDDCLIDWNRKSIDIHNHVRGLSPYPAAWTVIIEDSGRPLECKIFETKLTDKEATGVQGGTLKTDGKRLLAACSDLWLEIVSLQPAGKKRMAADAFLLGYHPSHIKIPFETQCPQSE
ncbi:MAG: methionyl-tRNA formyltransferase [Muribaculaceae bacterium]|nr:methionyl-tRNA formyltransferase [Muribaculaceae bacterium]